VPVFELRNQQNQPNEFIIKSYFRINRLYKCLQMSIYWSEHSTTSITAVFVVLVYCISQGSLEVQKKQNIGRSTD
jgi:hypothetical protein